MLEYVVGNIPGVIVGGAAGIAGTFFYIRNKLKKDPKWVEDAYQAQRAVSMKGTEFVEKENAELKKQIEDFKLKETYEKIKADIIKELRG